MGKNPNKSPVSLGENIDMAVTVDELKSTIAQLESRNTLLENKVTQLEKQTSFLHTLIDNIPIAMFVKNAREDFRITEWNQAAEAIFEVPKETVIGRTTHDLWPKEQADIFLADDQRVAQEQRVIDIAEEQCQTQSRGIMLLHTKKVPIINPHDGKTDFLLGICEDITEQKLTRMRDESRTEVLSLIMMGAPINQILDTIVVAIEHTHPPMLCSILLLHEDGKRLLVAAAPSFPSFYTHAIDGAEIGAQAGSCHFSKSMSADCQRRCHQNCPQCNL